MKSALYSGHVVHARLRPKRHRLRYRVFSLLIDLDELAELDRRRLFGVNRRALFSFWECDHGGAAGGLRSWVEDRLEDAGLPFSTLRLQVLCYPRILGYVFNPLTVYFCSEGEQLRAILYEVHNTHGEKRTYVIRVENDAPVVEQSCAKELYVSPFVPMECVYRFRIEPPAERVLVAIDETDAEGPLLKASFAGTRKALTDRTLLHAFLAYPLMTLKVTAAIHWEALKLWAKGVPVFRHRPAQAPIATTIVSGRAESSGGSRRSAVLAGRAQAGG